MAVNNSPNSPRVVQTIERVQRDSTDNLFSISIPPLNLSSIPPNYLPPPPSPSLTPTSTPRGKFLYGPSKINPGSNTLDTSIEEDISYSMGNNIAPLQADSFSPREAFESQEQQDNPASLAPKKTCTCFAGLLKCFQRKG